MTRRTGLFRSRRDVVVAGVASGIAYSLNVDPVIIRILFILLAIFGGGGVLIYLLLWIALPQEDPASVFDEPKHNETMDENTTREQKPSQEQQPRSSRDGGLIAGLILITVGVIFLADRFIHWLDFGDLWPVILVVAGIYLIFRSYNKINS